MNSTLDGTQNRTTGSTAQISEAISHGTQRLMQMKERVWGRSKGLARGMDSCVHEHTWMALGIAAAVGIIFGLAVSRR